MSLCSCTPCEGIHAQVTSQRGSGAPGIPGVLHTSEGDRSLSGTLHTGEDTRKDTSDATAEAASALATGRDG